MEAAIQEFSLKKVNLFMYTWGIPAVALIFSKAAGYMSAVLVGLAPSLVFLKYFSYFIIYCVNGFFGGTALGDCFIILVHFSF